MLDFVRIKTTRKETKNGIDIMIAPKFKVNLNTKDLMIKGGDFYAVWDEEAGLWSKSEQTVIDIVDEEIKKVARGIPQPENVTVMPLYMSESDSGSIDKWHKFVQKQMRDCFHPLDEKVIFANTDVKKEDYASKRLSYDLKEGSIEAYEELVGSLYPASEKEKIEWAIGSIVKGDSKHIQKFVVLYGDKGTGKGTVLDIVEDLFGGREGYTASFTAKDLGSANNAFALESFKDNPLVAIQQDGNLSRIEDNTKLNSVVSHEYMEVNAKYTKIYRQKFNAFLFMGTNNPVKITDAKSGILRRLIDVYPSGNRIPYRKYHRLKSQVRFELGAIAWHCLKIYEKLGEDYYEDYVPLRMMSATNDFYDFVEHNYEFFEQEDMVPLTTAWKMYGEYCDFANSFKMPYRLFRNELQNYFREFEERMRVDGKQLRSVYVGFIKEKFENPHGKEAAPDDEKSWLTFDQKESILDILLSECPAQYDGKNGGPERRWSDCVTHLKDLDTSRVHWIKLSDTPYFNLVCIDFDLKDENGEKSLALNLAAAEKWPKTYGELSNSGKAVHLYYIYDGDISGLMAIFDDNIEIKTFKGGATLRRRVSLCNSLEVAKIGNLPKKGEVKRVTNWDGIKNEGVLRAMIGKALRKGYHADTTSNVDYIKKMLDDAYEEGFGYDVSDMQQAITVFALNSTHQSDHCLDTVGEMKFRSKDSSPPGKDEPVDDRLVFFDIEIYRPDEATNNPGLFLIEWKYHGSPDVVTMVNPKPWEIEELFKYKLAGFNCKNYDNPMLYAASLGYSNQQLYNLSQEMIVEHKKRFYEAKNISEIDVYEMCTDKMSLKKWEYKLGEPHKEMDIPWDQPAPLDRWDDIIEYCKNDVFATEAVFDARQEDYEARCIQVDIVKILYGGEVEACINDSTNDLSKKIIFGNNKEPQGEFNYRDMSKPVGSDRYEEYVEKFGEDYNFRVFDANGLPLYRDYVPGEVLPEGFSILPFFKGYECVEVSPGKYLSTYLGEKIGEGGRVYSVPGYYEWVWDGDIASQHPHSIIAEVLFGKRYTKIFKELVDARVAVKHGDFETAGKLLGGALKPYLSKEKAKGLSQALKIVINSIYGLTKTSYINQFRDIRNYDNIVAKRGALFMTLLKQEVEKRGGFVCHIKTDSIKIRNCSEEMKDFVVRFGKEFGYDFETEDVFTKFVLCNDAAYVGLSESGEWVTKADQFKKEKQPYLYKTLFSHEPYELRDYCEVNSTSDGTLYLDMNEDLGEPVDDKYDKANTKLKKLRIKKAQKIREAYPSLAEDKVDEMVEQDGDVMELIDICSQLKEEIPKHHKYEFVGRVGMFTPIKEGKGGGKLLRYKDGKYAAVGGTKDNRWLESYHVKEYGLFNDIDRSYYHERVTKAKEAINEMVDVEWFLSDGIPEKTVDLFVPDPTDFERWINPPEVELPWN